MHELPSATDYRSLASAASGVAQLTPDGHGTFLHPLDEQTAADVTAVWTALTNGAASQPSELQLSGRTLHVPEASDAARAAKFGFDQLCGSALGPEDYLRLAKAYSVVVIERVPQVGHLPVKVRTR